MNPKVIAWMTSFLASKSLRVKLEMLLSVEVSVSKGVPQGLVIDPLLFLVMVNYLLEVVSQYFLLFAVGTKIGVSSVQREDIQIDLYSLDA